MMNSRFRFVVQAIDDQVGDFITGRLSELFAQCRRRCAKIVESGGIGDAGQAIDVQFGRFGIGGGHALDQRRFLSRVGFNMHCGNIFKPGGINPLQGDNHTIGRGMGGRQRSPFRDNLTCVNPPADLDLDAVFLLLVDDGYMQVGGDRERVLGRRRAGIASGGKIESALKRSFALRQAFEPYNDNSINKPMVAGIVCPADAMMMNMVPKRKGDKKNPVASDGVGPCVRSFRNGVSIIVLGEMDQISSSKMSSSTGSVKALLRTRWASAVICSTSCCLRASHCSRVMATSRAWLPLY